VGGPEFQGKAELRYLRIGYGRVQIWRGGIGEGKGGVLLVLKVQRARGGDKQGGSQWWVQRKKEGKRVDISDVRKKDAGHHSVTKTGGNMDVLDGIRLKGGTTKKTSRNTEGT